MCGFKKKCITLQSQFVAGLWYVCMTFFSLLHIIVDFFDNQMILCGLKEVFGV